MEPHVSLDTMQDLLVHQLRDLYSAEHQILEAWPRLTARSTARSLGWALNMRRRISVRRSESRLQTRPWGSRWHSSRIMPPPPG